MFCHRCGTSTQEGAKYCSNCGCALYGTPTPPPVTTDTLHPVLYGILGFLFPLIGLVLFLVWRTERPNASKAAGIGALANVISGAVVALVSLLIVIFTFGFAVTLGAIFAL